MKYWLLAVLLANITLFLVEFHYGAFESAISKDIGNESRQERMPYSSSGGSNLPGATRLASPRHFFNANASKEPQKNAGSPKDGQPILPDNISKPDASAQPSPLGLIQTPEEHGIPARADDNATVDKESLALPALQSAKQTLTETREPSKAAIEGDSAQPEVIKPISQVSKKDASETPSVKNKAFKDGVLINELAHPQKTSRKPDNVMTACYTTGPIKNVATLNALLRKFRPQLTELAMSSPGQARKAKKNNTYTVYYPAPPSMEESLATAAILKNNHGIKDLQIFRDGEMKGAISLGVYSNEQNALAAKSQFEQKGLQVQIKPRFPVQNDYKVRMRWTEQQENTAEQLIYALSGTYPDIKRIYSCE